MITKSYYVEQWEVNGLYYIYEQGFGCLSDGYKTEEEARESLEHVKWGEPPLDPQ